MSKARPSSKVADARDVSALASSSAARIERRFHNDDLICFLSFLRVWIDKHGHTVPSLLAAWAEFKSNHVMDQNPDIQDTTKQLTAQLIQRHKDRT